MNVRVDKLNCHVVFGKYFPLSGIKGPHCGLSQMTMGGNPFRNDFFVYILINHAISLGAIVIRGSSVVVAWSLAVYPLGCEIFIG